MSLRLPDPSGGRRDKRGAPPGGWPRSGARSTICWKRGGRPGAVEEVRARHEAGTRRMWLPKGKRTRLSVDRAKASRSFLGALSLTTRTMRTHPIQGDQDAEQTRPHDGSPGARDRRGTRRTAAVLDNARLHHAKALTDLYAPGRALERITPIYMPPLRPRSWVPPSTYGTPPEPAPPAPARSPRRTPSRPSPPTPPTTPSTTTSSTPNHTTTHRPCLTPAIPGRILAR